MRYFANLCKRYAMSLSFYAAIILMMLLCLFGMSARVEDEYHSVIELLLNSELMDAAKSDFACNSFYVINRFSGSPWYSVALPVITAFPALNIYISFSKPNCAFSLVRTSKTTYSVANVITAFLSGAFICIIGVILYSAFVYMILPDITSFGVDYLNEIGLGSVQERIFMLLPGLLASAVVGGLSAVIVIILYLFLHDKFLSLSIPMMVMYVSLKLDILYSMWIASNPSYQEDKLLNAVYILFPSGAANIHGTLQMLNFPYYLYFIFIGIVLFAFVCLFKGRGTRI